MNTLIILFIVVPILTLVLLALNLLFAPHNPDPEKVSTFEVGLFHYMDRLDQLFSLVFI